MADLSLAFDPAAISDAVSKGTAALSKVAVVSDAASDANSKIAAVSDVASKAQSKITAGSAVWDVDAASAISAVTARSAAWDGAAALASDAGSKAGAALSKANVALSNASDAQSAITALDATVIKSVPGVGSFAVHEIVYTAANTLKYVYSSVAG